MQVIMIRLSIICLLVFRASAEDMCDKKCICHPKKLDCKGLTQADIESDSFFNTITSDLERIHITDGNIPELPKNVLGSCGGDSSYRLDKLKKLDLQNNFIKSVYGQTFHCMPNLEELILANNQWNVSTIHTGVFTSIPKLVKLNLTNAFHDKMEASTHLARLNLVFMENDLQNLKVLALDYNRISVFDRNSADAICSFPALERLSLAHNLLPKITFYHIRCYPHLKMLDLSYNSIITIEDYTHSGLLYGLDYMQSASPNLTVNFVGNEFDCDCALLEFRNWLKRTRVHVIKKNLLKCHNGVFNNRSIISMQSSDFNCYSRSTTDSGGKVVKSAENKELHVGIIVVLAVVGTLFIIVIGLAVLLYLKRHQRKTDSGYLKLNKTVAFTVDVPKMGKPQ